MYKFKFADIGEGIHEGLLCEWLVKVGDEVKDGETLCTIETDKVNAEIPSPVNGKISKIYFEEGDTVIVGEVLVDIEDGSNETEAKQEEDNSGVVGELEVSNDVIEDSVESKVDSNHVKKVLATPVARKLAKDLEIDINTVIGTGPVGRVMKEDIYHAKENKKEAIKETPIIEVPKIEVKGEVERVKVSKLRKTIAKNMAISNTLIPHAATMDDFDVTDLVEFRNNQKGMAKEKGFNLTYMPFIIKAVAIALKEYPVFNSSYDHEQEELLLKKFYNIGIAVDTDDGLIVPVIKDADRLSVLEIAEKLENLATEARNRTISLDSLQGGTFTITNYGAFGLSYGVPMIKYPETAIIGIGMIKKQPVVINDEVVIRNMMPISLSFDHRVIDGGDAGRFLVRLKELVSNPMLLLLS